MKTTNAFLPFTDPSFLNRNNSEPQEVTAKDPLSTWVYFSGSSNDELLNSQGQVVLSQISRVTPVSFLLLTPFIPNVNPRNNVIEFFDTTAGPSFGLHTAIIPEGTYTSPLALATVIAQVMQAAGASNYSIVPPATPNLTPGTFTLTNDDSHLFYFTESCAAILRGFPCFGLGIGGPSTASISHQIGPMGLLYTEYIDVKSDALTDNSKLRSLALPTNRSSIFFRAFVTTNLSLGGSSVTVPLRGNDLIFNRRSEDPIVGVDIQLFDEFGQLLYIPPLLDNRFRYILIAACEI